MNDQMLKFLRRLCEQDSPVPVRAIGIGCSVPQGIARQEARRLGYAIFEAGCWMITIRGRMAILGVARAQAA